MSPTIPHGYRLVSGPHTAAEVEEGWTICAAWTGGIGADWQPRHECFRRGRELRAIVGGSARYLCNHRDPDRDIYRIEKVSP